MVKRVIISGLQVLIDIPGENKRSEVQEALDIMNKYLSRDSYIAGLAGQIIGIDNISNSDIEELSEE